MIYLPYNHDFSAYRELQLTVRYTDSVRKVRPYIHAFTHRVFTLKGDMQARYYAKMNAHVNRVTFAF